MEIEISDFTGCKIALFCGDKLLTILRDNKSNIPYPNTWELPGGGREGDESPFECAAREVYEELGIHLTEDCLLWAKVYPSMLFADKKSVFLVGKLAQEQFDQIVFGDEGQGYKLMGIEEFLGSDKAVPQLQDRVRDYLEEVNDFCNCNNDVK
ncbi:NUDIX domain-containing protein [Streptococcus halitosis]|uniref:NUDIX domain-containing protein n=2 Tax=Bacilli TaxID=91061 RepID=A0A3R8LSR6_9STRE|nr:NUDIX hydrolase [Streptococcus halitosis]RRN47429.1 NUDIX domain-containing protein [Streptococcus halitosis]